MLTDAEYEYPVGGNQMVIKDPEVVLTAEQAKNLANSFASDTSKRQLKEIMRMIHSKAMNGESEISASIPLPVVQSKLKELGYNVQVYVATEQRDESSMKVRW